MADLIDAGIDGICTDVPDVLIDVLRTGAANGAPR
jgi:glycerophosphoryl diester phosphodiesterase